MKKIFFLILIIFLPAFLPAAAEDRPEPPREVPVCFICTDITGNITREGCMIKGNINKKGEKIYHCPRWRDYDKTIIDEEHGERWFCTEDEARSAGWRSPKYNTGPCR